VVEGSIFDSVPAAGTWGTALLLDGNIGIGGDPVALLVRVAALLCPGGRILAELGAPGTTGGTRRARVDHGSHTGPWFDWGAVCARSIATTAADAGLEVVSSWHAGGRWFAQISTPLRYMTNEARRATRSDARRWRDIHGAP